MFQILLKYWTSNCRVRFDVTKLFCLICCAKPLLIVEWDFSIYRQSWSILFCLIFFWNWIILWVTLMSHCTWALSQNFVRKTLFDKNPSKIRSLLYTLHASCLWIFCIICRSKNFCLRNTKIEETILISNIQTSNFQNCASFSHFSFPQLR